jgi:hypothetical protein
MKGLWSRTAVTVMAAAMMVVGAALPAASAVSREAIVGGRAISASEDGGTAKRKCAPVRPALEFYEAGRIGSFPLTTPRSACTTISVSHIKDAANPSDRCQTFLVGFYPADGSDPTTTEPVTACAVPPNTRTVLATNVPDGVVYRIIYNVDYIDPRLQIVRYKVWH